MPYIALVPIAVTADNVLETVIADGFRTIEEICTGDVAATTSAWPTARIRRVHRIRVTTNDT